VGECKSSSARYGVVAIGRNEGERLRKCLESALSRAATVVYVDSGSTDNSVAIALALGSSVVELDMRIPFTAARARNEGFKRLQQLNRSLPYVQFVDGDCLIVNGWLEAAAKFLDSHPDVAAVCGRRREIQPGRSIYNLLCDIEWDTPIGETRKCGGDAMMRITAFEAAKGYRENLIAGEEPELCVRLRAAAWRIWRLDVEMTLHDAAMMRFGQWWKRNKRAGHAFAEGAWLHGAPPELHYSREAKRALAWGVLIPYFILIAAYVHPLWLGLLLIYPLQVARIAFYDNPLSKTAWLRSTFLMLGRLPEGQGLLTFYANKLIGKRGALIEYK